jgi:predicted TIM-barrel enzyme
LCAATGARFVRVNVHTGAAVTDQGLIQGRAAETLRERQRLCPDVALLCDVQVKHATPLGGESSPVGTSGVRFSKRACCTSMRSEGSVAVCERASMRMIAPA